MIAKTILFRPSYVLLASPTLDGSNMLELSSIHALVTPFIQRLNESANSANPKHLAKANECLQRIASGLGANKSVDPRELLLYIYSTATPFLKSKYGVNRKIDINPEDDENESDSEESSSSDESSEEEELEWTAKRTLEPSVQETELPSSMSKRAKKRQAEKRRARKSLDHSTWLPSLAAGDRLRDGGGGVKNAYLKGTPAQQEKAHKKDRKFASVQVLDGVQAPRLTGKDRLSSHHRPGEGSSHNDAGDLDEEQGREGDAPIVLNETASNGSIYFALTVLHIHLKRGVISPSSMSLTRDDAMTESTRLEVIAMAEPYLSLLHGCARGSVANDQVRLLALQCLCMLLSWPLEALPKYSIKLGKGLLKLLTWANSRNMGLGDHELVQGCFKGLTTLLHYEPSDGKKDVIENKEETPLQLTNDQDEESKEDGIVEMNSKKGPMMVLNMRQMKALVLILHSAVLDSSHQTASFNLVKALVHQKVVVSEM